MPNTLLPVSNIALNRQKHFVFRRDSLIRRFPNIPMRFVIIIPAPQVFVRRYKRLRKILHFHVPVTKDSVQSGAMSRYRRAAFHDNFGISRRLL